MADLETTVELLKKELHDQAKIHDRLDIAIEKLTDVSNSIHRMLAVHEEKLTRQEEAILSQEEQLESRRLELSHQIQELHSRITTNTKEIMTNAAAQHAEQNREIQRMRDEGKTIVLTTHYMEEAEALCDRVAIMDRGKIVANAPPKELIKDLLSTGFKKERMERFATLEDVFLQLTGHPLKEEQSL